MKFRICILRPRKCSNRYLTYKVRFQHVTRKFALVRVRCTYFASLIVFMMLAFILAMLSHWQKIFQDSLWCDFVLTWKLDIRLALVTLATFSNSLLAIWMKTAILSLRLWKSSYCASLLSGWVSGGGVREEVGHIVMYYRGRILGRGEGVGE